MDCKNNVYNTLANDPFYKCVPAHDMSKNPMLLMYTINLCTRKDSYILANTCHNNNHWYLLPASSFGKIYATFSTLWNCLPPLPLVVREVGWLLVDADSVDTILLFLFLRVCSGFICSLARRDKKKPITWVKVNSNREREGKRKKKRM